MSRPAFEQYTPEELDTKIQAFLDQREADDKPLHMYAVGVHINASPDTLTRYNAHEPQEGQPHVYDAHCGAIKRGFRRCEAWNSDQLYTGKPVGAIFVAKCAYRWQETATKLDIGGFNLLVNTTAADADED